MTTQPSASAVTISDERIDTKSPARKEALGCLAHFILSGKDFTPKHAKELLALMAEMETALRSAPAPEWQGMESAKEDGTGMLLWVSSWGTSVVGYFSGSRWVMPVGLDGFMVIPEPNGWQPLPAAPVGEPT